MTISTKGIVEHVERAFESARIRTKYSWYASVGVDTLAAWFRDRWRVWRLTINQLAGLNQEKVGDL